MEMTTLVCSYKHLAVVFTPLTQTEASANISTAGRNKQTLFVLSACVSLSLITCVIQ